MLNRILPLELILEFEPAGLHPGRDNRCCGGDAAPAADIRVRNARLDLVCEEHYTQRGVSFVPDFYATDRVISGQTSHVAQERKEQFVHSTVQFMEETRLTGDTADEHGG